MNKEDLRLQLNLLHVKATDYSLDGLLKNDCVVLHQNYYKWEVLYIDEKGRREDEKIFNSESEACYYILKLFTELKEIEKRFNLNTKR